MILWRERGPETQPPCGRMVRACARRVLMEGESDGAHEPKRMMTHALLVDVPLFPTVDAVNRSQMASYSMMSAVGIKRMTDMSASKKDMVICGAEGASWRVSAMSSTWWVGVVPHSCPDSMRRGGHEFGSLRRLPR